MLLLLCAHNAHAKPKLISEIQGDRQTSAFDGKEVTVQGIVTARVRNGFYIQTPDGADDKNPKTSEGILIFTGKEPRAEATIGNLVEVTGLVIEYVPKSEPVTLPLTEIRVSKPTDEIKVISKNQLLPKPIVLTATDFEAANANQALETLERYEGMRVKITSLTVSAPTNGRVDEKTATAISDGVFYGVLTGTPRPFRQPGIELFETANLKPEPTVPVFDNNPQVLRIDSDAQLGAAAIEVTSNATIKNLVGVLDYSYRAWTILPDAANSPVILGNMVPTAVVAATEREFAIASFNVERLMDNVDEPATDEPILTSEAFQNRLKKASLIIRDYLKTPDVLALIEVENLATLQKLADRINADVAASGRTDFKYQPFLIEGNDSGGIDTGFLVNTTRVLVRKTEQLAKVEMHKRPSDSKNVNVFDRPPLVLRALIKDGDKNLNFTVVANHLKSLRDVFDKDGNTRMKKKLQAEFLARWANKFQTETPNEPLILVGDMNAFEFSDGLVDVIGTLTGKPAAANKVLLATEDLVNPDLTNLTEAIPPAERYSYLFAGNAQTLDHVLVNEAAKKLAVRFGFARIGTDFPESLRSDANRPERLSDHDAAVAYFSLDAAAEKR